jgi:hypothetical protein
MTTYYTGVQLADVVTGFGGYTGLVLVNSGNFPIKYDINISKTNLQGIDASDCNDTNTGTLFISADLNNINLSNNEVELTVNPSSSGVVYVLHRPYRNFTSSFITAGNIDGYESAEITVKSLSSVGDEDENITIDVTGRRIKTFSTPPRIGSFFAVEDYNSTLANPLYRNFFWSVITNNTFLTGFNLQLSANTSFTSPTTYQYSVVQNQDANLPLYGNYKGLLENIYSIDLTDFTINTNYYARIQGVNNAGVGDYSYCTGFDNYNVDLDGTGYSGLYTSPGGNLKVNYRVLNLSRYDTYEKDFDLYEYLVSQNNNSYDFRRYSGIYVKFFSNNAPALCNYVASSKTTGAINFNIPYINGGDGFLISPNSSNRFSIELEFNNCGLYGHGGDGLIWKNDNSNLEWTYFEPTDGGPIFNFDNYTYNAIPIDYYIYKDIYSVMYAGSAGSKGWLINIENNDALDTQAFHIDGFKIINALETP